MICSFTYPFCFDFLLYDVRLLKNTTTLPDCGSSWTRSILPVTGGRDSLFNTPQA